MGECTVEEAAIAWFEGLGYSFEHGQDIAPGEMFAERKDYVEILLSLRLCDALLPRLVSGEIRVKDGERTVEAAT